MAVSATNRRTTLTLPASTLATAKRLAHKRKVTLNVVVNEALEEGLRQKLALERAEDFVQRMSQAFVGLTEDELLLVNGIDLTERRDRRRR
jgi:transcription initiation factor TFIID subunit TAF12